MGQETEERKKQFAPYQVDEEPMNQAASKAIFPHSLPAHHSEEVTAGVIDGGRGGSLTKQRTGCTPRKRSSTCYWGKI
ncbi:MAG: ornithine carbamoyltransferase [Rubrobacteraceae bacterium]|jgi:ornithine carbamoyltransferase|nr:ornithine carbamoyltransferase [Rubrobacteraceae bacterium]